MTRLTCTACGTPVARNEAIQRATGDLLTVRAWHRDCWTVVRALKGIDFAALEHMPLTRRMMLAEVERMGS